MTALPDTFCVFILTHGRPDNVITLKTLEKCGYTGRLYLIVDDEDKTIDQYKRNFGAERVIVFNKKAEADACDEGNNFDEHRTILMARNSCFKIADTLGVTHFIELDDDYYYFGMRFHEGAKKIVNLNAAFGALLEYYKSAQITSIAFAQGGDHIGGFSGVKLKRKCMNSFLCSTERPFQFVGAMNEDVNTYTTLGSRGGLFLTFTPLQLDQKDTQSQTNGITGMYQRFGTYCKAFTTVMMLPSAVKVSMMQSDHPRIHHSISWKQAVPCIIREKYMKGIRKVSATPVVEAQAVDVGVEPPAPEPCGEETEQDKIAAALSAWPDLARYASTARIETTLVYNRETDAIEERRCVTVTCFDKAAPATSDSADDTARKG